jgi:hypothetical protein
MPFLENSKDCQKKKSHEQLVSLKHLPRINIPWVSASVAQRCGSHKDYTDYTSDAPFPPNACAAPWSWWCSLHDGVHYSATVCTSLSLLFLIHKHCHTRPASANESLLLCPRTKSQHTDLAWLTVEFDTPYFLDWHMSLHWTVTLALVMQLTPYPTLLIESWYCMTLYSWLEHSGQVSIEPPHSCIHLIHSSMLMHNKCCYKIIFL